MEHLLKKTMNNKILTETFEEMDYIFSSNQFAKIAKRKGLSQYEISQGVIGHFLHNNAIQQNSRRIWRKKNNLFNEPTSEELINNAIELLKKNGYKISKQFIDWREI